MGESVEVDMSELMVVPSSLFVSESDRWLTSLVPYLSTRMHSLPFISTTSQLPRATLTYISLHDAHGTYIERLCEVAEWCLVIVAWNVGLRFITRDDLPLRMLDICAFSLMVGKGLGKVLELWRQACQVVYDRRVN